MQVAVKRVDVEHEATFSVPFFDLADRRTEMLRCLHNEVSSKYRIRSEDMWISKGGQLSELQVGIDMFDRHGLIDVTADRLSVSFKSVRNEKQATICRDCISLSESALRNAFPELTVNTAAFKLTLFFQLNDNTTSASQHLSQVTESSFKGDLDAFGSVRTLPRVNLDIDNDEEYWRAFFSAYGSGRNPQLLNAYCRFFYDYEDTTIRRLTDKLLHMERLVSAFFGGIGLDAANPLFGMGVAE